MADKTQNNSCESLYTGVYTEMTTAQNPEHCYSSLIIETNQPKKVFERMNTFVNRKFSIFTLGACTLIGLIVGCVISGFVVYNLTRTSDACSTATSKQLTEVGETTAVSTAWTSIYNTKLTVTDTQTIPYSDLNGKYFKIACVENGKFWHYDAFWNNDTLSVLRQTDDDYVKFKFIQQADYTFKIESVGGRTYISDGYGVKGSEVDVLNGKPNRDDDHARFLVTIETEGFYRIQTKATRRFVGIDKNHYVSSKENIKDNRSLYTFIEKK